MRAFSLSLLVLASCASLTPAEPAPTEEKASRFDTRISFQLQRASLHEALSLITRKSGLHIVVQPGVSGTLTMSVNDVPAGEVVEAVAKTFGLKATRVDSLDIVRVSAR